MVTPQQSLSLQFVKRAAHRGKRNGKPARERMQIGIPVLADRKGVQDERLRELRWLLEELRVSLFAQELRTPQPVSVKRLDKVWAQIR